jgi:hypothetical protein
MFFVAVGFAIAGVVQSGVLGGNNTTATYTSPDGKVYEYPDDCQPGVPFQC